MSMTIRCLVLSHTDDDDNPSGQPYQRLVEIPVNENELHLKADHEILDLAFQYGQNDFSGGQPSHNTTYSLSMGDVILYDDKIHLIAAVGFVEITKSELEDLIITSRRDRPFHPRMIGNDNSKLVRSIQEKNLEYRRRQHEQLKLELEGQKETPETSDGEET